MSTSRTVAVVLGSLRRDSWNRRVANALIHLAPPDLAFQMIEIGSLPLYNEDVEPAPPQAWTSFREAIKAADAVLFMTPEYNRSVPGGLKNAIDVGSRPYGANVWSGKPAAIISVSIGAIGGFGANHHLRQALVAVNMRTMAQPEAYIGAAPTLFDERGELVSRDTADFLEVFARALSDWI